MTKTQAKMPALTLLSGNCHGPNRQCQLAAKLGWTVHMITNYDTHAESLVMPSWHFPSEQVAEKMLICAYRTAPTIHTDEELNTAREARIPHKLPIGWVDPSMRDYTLA